MTRPLLALLTLAAGLALAAFTLSDSNVRVVDGDSLVVEGQRVRLWGVDAVEQDQPCFDSQGSPYPCGRLAALALRNMVTGLKVECWVEYRDLYDRAVATCSVGGADLGEAMVRDGWAVDWPRYSRGAYAKAEAEARVARRGIWQGDFQRPEEFRRAKGGAR